MKKKWIVLGLILIFAAGAAVFRFQQANEARKKSGGTAVTATTGPIQETVEATGEVAPLNRVEIKPPVQGRIEKLLVDEGATVKAGQVLAWMSSSDRAAILDAARSQGPAEVKHWEDAYKATPILAPLSGVVILRNVVVGQTVDLSVVLYAMSDKLIVIADVDEADIGRVRVNMAARIVLDAYPAQQIDGRVFQILHEGKNQSNVITYGVKIEPQKIPSFFRSQMTANVSLIVRQKDEAVLVPLTAIHENSAGKKTVAVVQPDGQTVSTEVQTGMESEQNVEITDGLRPGDKVLVSRAKYVPQQNQQTSPLTMGGRPQSGGGSGRGGGRSRQP